MLYAVYALSELKQLFSCIVLGKKKKKRKSVFMLFIASVSKQDEQAY